jgi:hypothetical protein
MVLVCQRFRLTAVIEAAMEIAGMQAAQKRLHVRAAGRACSAGAVLVVRALESLHPICCGAHLPQAEAFVCHSAPVCHHPRVWT